MPRIYTRTGDSGTTSLCDGSRRRKDSPQIEAYGTIDELNSQVGVLIASQPLAEHDRRVLTAVQSTLFDIGAYLAAGSDEMAQRLLPALAPALELLEGEIDRIDAGLPRHNRFILPQGTASAAAAHVCRSVARRAERRIVAMTDTVAVDADVLRWINRLSDYMFVLARRCNVASGTPEIFYEKS